MLSQKSKNAVLLTVKRLADTTGFTLSWFQVYRSGHQEPSGRRRAHGGTALLIRRTWRTYKCRQPIVLNQPELPSTLEVVKCLYSLFNAGHQVAMRLYEHGGLLAAPSAGVIREDFNAKHFTWGCSTSNNRG